MKTLKKILIIISIILALYLWGLAFLRLNPSIEILTEKTKCLPQFSYEIKKGIKILDLRDCEDPYKIWKFHGRKLKEHHWLK